MDKCIIIHDKQLVKNRQGHVIMSCKDAEEEVMFGVGALYPKAKYAIYKLKRKVIG